MPHPHSRPPALARLLLRLTLPENEREYLVGDLEEEYADAVRPLRGRLGADLWFWDQTLRSVAVVAAAAIRGGGRTPPDGPASPGRALRSLLRSPAWTLMTVGTLAVGIGAVTAAFTVLHQVVLRPLPVEDQSALVVAWHDHRVRDFPHYPFTYDAIREVRDGATTLTDVAATDVWGAGDRLVELDGQPTVLAWSRVVGDYFGTLGVEPVAGRLLRPDDDLPGAPRVAVIGHGLWQRAFGGSRSALGATLRTGDASYTVVGVVPQGLEHPVGTEVWSPTRADYPEWSTETPQLELDLVARLAPGATAVDAAAEIRTLLLASPRTSPIYENTAPVVRSFTEVVLGDLRATMFLIFGAGVLVMGIACFNVANLVLVRAGRRETSLAVKRALGAGRGRIAREALAEASVMGLAGGLGGAALAALAIRVLVPLAPADLPRVSDLGSPGPGPLLLTAILSLGTVLTVTALTVGRAGRIRPAAVLRAGGRGHTGGRRRAAAALMAGQAGFAVWAAATGVVLARSVRALSALDPGFDAADVVLVEMEVPHDYFEVPESYPDQLAAVGAELERHPGIGAVTSALSPPLAGETGFALVPILEGQSAEEARASNPFVNLEPVEADYFRTLELPVVRGRAVTEADREGTEPVVVVNETAARVLWPGESALGRTLNAGLPGYQGTWWRVVGVARDARYQGLLEIRPVLYFPLRQLDAFAPPHLLVRTTSPDAPVLSEVRAAVERHAPGVRVKQATPLSTRLAAPLVRPRLGAVLLGALAGVALLLASVGVYGVMAAVVGARTREMGIRIACGARPGAVRRLVLGQGVGVAAAGAGLGLVGVLLTGRLVEGLTFGVSSGDPWSLAMGTLVVLAAAAAASWLPALRASRLDPARILTSE